MQTAPLQISTHSRGTNDFVFSTTFSKIYNMQSNIYTQ